MLALIVLVNILYASVFFFLGHEYISAIFFLLSIIFFAYFQASFVLYEKNKNKEPRKSLISPELKAQLNEEKWYYLWFFILYSSIYILSNYIKQEFDYMLYAIHIILLVFAYLARYIQDELMLLLHRTNTIILLFLWFSDAIGFLTNTILFELSNKTVMTWILLILSTLFLAFFDKNITTQWKKIFYILWLNIVFLLSIFLLKIFFTTSLSIIIISPSLWLFLIFILSKTRPFKAFSESTKIAWWWFYTFWFISVFLDLFTHNISSLSTINLIFTILFFSIFYWIIYFIHKHIASLFFMFIWIIWIIIYFILQNSILINYLPFIYLIISLLWLLISWVFKERKALITLLFWIFTWLIFIAFIGLTYLNNLLDTIHLLLFLIFGSLFFIVYSYNYKKFLEEEY